MGSRRVGVLSHLGCKPRNRPAYHHRKSLRDALVTYLAVGRLGTRLGKPAGSKGRWCPEPQPESCPSSLHRPTLLPLPETRQSQPPWRLPLPCHQCCVLTLLLLHRLQSFRVSCRRKPSCLACCQPHMALASALCLGHPLHCGHVPLWDPWAWGEESCKEPRPLSDPQLEKPRACSRCSQKAHLHPQRCFLLEVLMPGCGVAQSDFTVLCSLDFSP